MVTVALFAVTSVCITLTITEHDEENYSKPSTNICSTVSVSTEECKLLMSQQKLSV